MDSEPIGENSFTNSGEMKTATEEQWLDVAVYGGRRSGSSSNSVFWVTATEKKIPTFEHCCRVKTSVGRSVWGAPKEVRRSEVRKTNPPFAYELKVFVPNALKPFPIPAPGTTCFSSRIMPSTFGHAPNTGDARVPVPWPPDHQDYLFPGGNRQNALGSQKKKHSSE